VQKTSALYLQTLCVAVVVNDRKSVCCHVILILEPKFNDKNNVSSSAYLSCSNG